jgi:hypothetical protein
MVDGVAGDLALAFLESVAGQRVDDFLRLREPSMAGPAHPADTTELQQTI